MSFHTDFLLLLSLLSNNKKESRTTGTEGTFSRSPLKALTICIYLRLLQIHVTCGRNKNTQIPVQSFLTFCASSLLESVQTKPKSKGPLKRCLTTQHSFLLHFLALLLSPSCLHTSAHRLVFCTTDVAMAPKTCGYALTVFEEYQCHPLWTNL